MVISSPCLTDIKNWLVQKQTTFGKDFSNPFTADSLLKTIWFSTHHASHAPCYSNEALAIPEQTATGKEISNPFMAGEDCWVLEDFTTYCCWFNIGAASEDLVLLRKIEENRLMFNQCFIIVALDLSKVTNPLQAKGSRSIQKMTEQDSPPPTITAMKIPIIKKGEYDIWSMRMRQYICHTDHNLWDIIVDGDLQEEAAPAGEQSGPPAPKTAKQLTAKRNQERVKSILLLAIPDEYLLKFHNVPDAKSLWAAIKSRFGGNDESKKMQRNYQRKISTKSFELKPLPDNLEYVFLEEPSFLPVIISFKLSTQNKNKLVSILKKHKEAFAWKTTDILGIYPSFCKYKIQLLDDKKSVVQKQRRLNPNMQEVVKKEIIKLLDNGIIYPITDRPWVSPIHCVPKKDGKIVVINENDELIPTRIVTGWRVCIDYRKLNEATAKDHFPLLFMDQMLERLAGNKYFCFLDGFSGYFQIPIDPMDQEKTTFTCPFGTYAYRRIPFGL
ncbi:hypothetical protein Tco_1336970 [Tanacetum coccineum]